MFCSGRSRTPAHPNERPSGGANRLRSSGMVGSARAILPTRIERARALAHPARWSIPGTSLRSHLCGSKGVAILQGARSETGLEPPFALLRAARGEAVGDDVPL